MCFAVAVRHLSFYSNEVPWASVLFFACNYPLNTDSPACFYARNMRYNCIMSSYQILLVFVPVSPLISPSILLSAWLNFCLAHLIVAK